MDSDSNKRSHTTLITASKRYETFQLYARVANKSTDANSAIELCILETFDWIRNRLGKAGKIPEELQLPTPNNHADFREDLLKSFHLDFSASIDVIYTRKETREWSMRITESDGGANMGTDKERPPVPGRFFETNISFLLKAGVVYAGFKTICSQPVNCGEDCEVFRPRLVRNICDNPNLGLRQVSTLAGKAKIIESDKDIRKMLSLMENKERQIPILLITQMPEKKQQENPIISTISNRYPTIFPTIPEEKTEAEAQYLFGIPEEEIGSLASELIAVCIIRIVPKKFFREIKDYFSKVEICQGDWIICYPDNEPEEIITSYKIINNTSRKIKTLKEKMMEFSKRRNINFGDLKFFIDANLDDRQSMENHLTSTNENLEYLKEENKALKEKVLELEGFKNDHQKTFDENKFITRELDKIKDILTESETEILRLKEQIEKKNQELNKKANTIESYRTKCKDAAKFPTYLKDIPSWVEKEFAGYVSIHPRALNELKSCKRPDVTPFILSTAIYYIAGYSRYRKQEISQEDLDRLYRIDCKWEVTLSGKESVRNFSDEYSVTVKNEKGKPQKLDLDLHLKTGIKNNDLIRIYFCWDKEKKEILIGSWPEHLR